MRPCPSPLPRPWVEHVLVLLPERTPGAGRAARIADLDETRANRSNERQSYFPVTPHGGKGAGMTERKSPTAVLREGPRALSDDQVREIEDSALAEVLHVDIDDVIEYVHKDLKSLPDFTTLYRKYLKQR